MVYLGNTCVTMQHVRSGKSKKGVDVRIGIPFTPSGVQHMFQTFCGFFGLECGKLWSMGKIPLEK